MLSAMQLTIWAARKVMAASACTAASATPARSAATSAMSRLPLLSATKMPKNAPTSMQPSSAMFVTPERSVMTPPSAANAMGVARRSVAASTPAPRSSSTLTAPPSGGARTDADEFDESASLQHFRGRPAAARERANDRLRGDHEQHDGFDDLDQVRADARVRLHDRATALEGGEEQRRERDADGGALPEERDPDGVEAEAGREAVIDAGEDAAHLDHPRQAGEAAGDGHHQDHAPARIDAGLRGRPCAEPDGAQLVAEAGAP